MPKPVLSTPQRNLPAIPVLDFTQPDARKQYTHTEVATICFTLREREPASKEFEVNHPSGEFLVVEQFEIYTG